MRGFMSRLGSTYWPVAVLIIGLGFILWSVVAYAEEPVPSPEKPAAGMSERCEAWLVYMVDGNGPAPRAIHIIGAGLWNEVAMHCLGRPANLFAQKVHPEHGPQLQTPGAPAPPPDPAAANPKVTL